MSNKVFVEKFVNEIKSIIAEKKLAGKVNRRGTKGDIMEEATFNLFLRYFPNRCGFGKGEIHDSLGHKSKEVDIVIFDRDNIPPICLGIKNISEKIKGFFPIESLWYAVEVKKTLNNIQLSEAIKNLRSVRELKSIKSTPPRMLFAYDSDLKGTDIQKEFNRYKKIDNDWNKNPMITVICIVGKGYLFSQIGIRNSDGKKVLFWKYVKAQKKYFEVAICLSGMINTITGQNFDPYLFEQSNIKILEEIEL